MNNEYEYSLKVKNVDDFINYCIDNTYELIEDYYQVRILYKNDTKIMARITRNETNDGIVEVLNFKDDNLTNEILKVSRESLDMEINDSNRKFVESMLNILNYNVNTVLKRNRKTFKKNNVKFEIDEYIEPKMNVLAIEGKKEDVDQVYNAIKEIIDVNNIENDI